MRDWYAAPSAANADGPEDKPLVKVEWSWLLDQWALIECDLHEKFGVDVESGILRERTWRWLNLRINDLITQPSRLRTAVASHYGPEV
ncbi:hypothetical protein [Corynebacterium liangguodongii]|uniref:hypothetical protein n=1 Tax=Corynebacterium liangguodongii TaxID=2079535 RepID=UPI0018EE5021|nr:hypothetical protein [Corynebacterium liangguodongii]